MDKLDKASDSDQDDMDRPSGPSPLEFDLYLPWASVQLQCMEEVVVIKEMQNEYVSAKDDRKSKHKMKQVKPSAFEVQSDHHIDVAVGKSRSSLEAVEEDTTRQVKIVAMYTNDYCTEIKFLKNKTIPRVVLRIISLIIQFHMQIQTITINSGMDRYTLHELTRLLPMSNITAICLDGAYISDCDYHILLDNPVHLRNLSLARCSVNDKCVEAIASKLIYPLPASKTLAILNLSTNRITDFGAMCLARALRANECLNYLNLAGNMLTDLGVNAILNMLFEFELTDEEITTTRKRHMEYLKEKYILIDKLIDELRSIEVEKRSLKKKKTNVPTNKKPKLEKSESLKTLPDLILTPEIETYIHQRAEHMAINFVGDFADPFNQEKTIVKNNIMYCKGNNTLCYLNIAFNNLTYISVKKLLSVVEYQTQLRRKPRGLITVCIEGNEMPTNCEEYEKIEDNLDTDILDKKSFIHKKRSVKAASVR